MPKIMNKGSQTMKRYPIILTSLFMMLGGMFLPLSLSATITDLHNAAARGDVAEITRLLDAGADIEARAGSGYTALHAAAFGGHSEAIITLLGRGTNIQARADEYGTTALHLAVQEECCKCQLRE